MSGKTYAYVGNWSTKGDGGIGIYEYDPSTGETKYIKTVREDIVAGLIIADRKRGVIYSIDERSDNPDMPAKSGGGRVFSLRVDPETGYLEEVSRQSSFGSMPAYITDDGTGNGLLLCNHSGNAYITRIVKEESGRYSLESIFSDTTIVHYPINDDGGLGSPDDIYITPTEGEFYSCLHSVNLAPDGHSLVVCERNQDKVYLMHFDADSKKLILDGAVQFERGKGIKDGHCPRYSAFHPTKPFVYINSEYLLWLTVMSYGAGLETVKILDVTPPSAGGRSLSQSDLTVSADGRFLYTMYRGINMVCVYAIDQETGIPEFVQEIALSGKGPRGCKLSPDGRFLLVANLDSKDVTTLAVADDGTLTETAYMTFGQEHPGNVTFYEV
ncbi:MAG: lactonase family protein [Lachnospiraceae bacterium]|nr:lactonase family protein [Lachnospiraceae bacterium]